MVSKSIQETLVNECSKQRKSAKESLVYVEKLKTFGLSEELLSSLQTKPVAQGQKAENQDEVTASNFIV